MRLGEYRYRLKIQSAYTRRDSEGGAVKCWKTVAKRDAKIEPYSGTEYSEANTTRATVSHKVVIRFFSGLKASMRLVHGKGRKQRVFNIETILPDVKTGNTDHTVLVKENIE